MALIRLEGFDGISASTGNASAADTDKHILYLYPHSNFTANVLPRVHAGRLGGQCFSYGNNSFSASNWFDITFPSAQQTFIVGFAYKPPQHRGLANSDIFRSYNSENGTAITEHIVLGQEHGATLYIERGATRLATAIHVMQPSRWNYVECKVTISNTVGVVEVRVNGKTVINLTSADTNNGGADEVTMLRMVGHNNSGGSTAELQHLMDDLYVCDGSGSVNNDFLGPLKIEQLAPDGVGDSSQFTPSAGSNWQNVDDTASDDGDTTYNQSSTTAHKDLFTCGNLTNITGTIHGVQVTSVCCITQPQPFGVKPKVKSSTTEGTGGTRGIGSPTPDYVGHQSVFEQDPNIAGAWTTTTVNAMQIGYEVA
jgi:hypothetical protein